MLECCAIKKVIEGGGGGWVNDPGTMDRGGRRKGVEPQASRARGIENGEGKEQRFRKQEKKVRNATTLCYVSH